MIDVTTNWGLGLLVAGIAGVAGGLIYELLLVRSRHTGTVEIPGWRGSKPRRLFDLGFGASILIGAAAAIAFCFFNPPKETVVTKDVTTEGAVTGTETTTTREYDGIRLVAVSLLVGSAGSSILTAMQEKVKTAVSASNVQLLAAVGRKAKADADAATTRLSAASNNSAELALVELRGTLGALDELGKAAGAAPARE